MDGWSEVWKELEPLEERDVPHGYVWFFRRLPEEERETASAR